MTTRDSHCHSTNETFNLVRCSDCDLIYIDPVPTREHISSYYSDEYYNPTFKKLEYVYCNVVDFFKIRRIEKHRKKGKILDVGCGSGRFLKNMQKRGWEVYGVDTSREACKLANEELKQNIFNRELEECPFPDAYFDVITLWHVLEHVLNPNQVLREINKILKGNGILIIEVPSIKNPVFELTKENYFALDTPRHLYHYTPKTLELMLNKNDFVILNRSFPLMGSPFSLFRSCSNLLEHKYRISQTWLSLLMPLLSPILVVLVVLFRLASLVIPSGEMIQVHCVKKGDG